MADSRWDQKYLIGDIPWDTGKPSSELLRVAAAEAIRPCRAADLGCGTGASAVWLATQGFEVTGIDVSSVAIDRARQRAISARAPVQFICTDLTRPFPIGPPYGFFFDRGCYHVIRRDNVQAYLSQLFNILKPGALGLVLAGNSREQIDPGPPVVEEADIRREFGSLFDILWIREFRFDQPDQGGPRPLGWSCLMRKKDCGFVLDCKGLL